ncbi:MAG: hypothetical protein Q9163_005904, partial [Psora crenata]
MQSVQRRFGKLLPRTADESQVAVLLKDFDDAEKMLAKIIDASKAWRDSWRDILGTQERLVHGFQTIYAPIIGANEEYSGHEPVITDQEIMARTTKLYATYEELRTDLLEEVNMVDTRIIKPAVEAKDCLQPLKKVIKKRGDRKLDFEKYQNRVDTGRKKTKRSERDNASLEKAEQELIRAKEKEYHVADDRLKSTLPPVITAAFSILPHLLAAQIMTQNTLLAQYYTLLHGYCEEEAFPDPPPSASQIISAWDAEYRPVKQRIETGIACLAGGKAVKQPMRIEDQTHSSVTGLNIRNGISNQRRPTSHALKPPPSPAVSASSDPPSPDPVQRPRISSVPSQTSLSLATPNYGSSTMRSQSPGGPDAHAPAGPRADYFGRDRVPSSSSMVSIAAAKKKPPPPPPPKRLASSQGIFVTAMYDFDGQGQGDLVFKEGDRIKIIKKTEIFDLPNELLANLQLRASHDRTPPVSPDPAVSNDATKTQILVSEEGVKPSTSCVVCGARFASVQEQRQHVKSDWHNYNLKQKLKGAKPVSETEFEKLLDELDESISGSGSETSESDEDGEGTKENKINALFRKQAKLSDEHAEEEELMSKRRGKRGVGKPPLIWFSTPLLRPNISLGVYRALLTNVEQEQSDIVEVFRKKQLRPVPAKPPSADASNGVPLPSTMTSPSIFMCMVGGGHFAGMIVSLAPKLGKQATGTEQRQAIVIAHKTFHRYTTRRKQGGGQSANDAAKGAAHSAGSSLRRYNEVALEQEIRALLFEWRELIGNAQLIFVRAAGSSNRRILFGPYEGQVLRHDDPRNRTFPFSTRRATQAELMRAFVELTRMKVSQVDEAALAAAAAATAVAKAEAEAQSPPQAKKISPPKPSKEEEEAALHTSQIQALVRRSKAPALLSYLSTNNLSPNYPFHPSGTQAHHHAPTPLHLASSINSSAVVLALLTKASADPTLPNREGKTPFDLAGDRATRDIFRVARSELGESRWDWSAARVPPPLSKAEAEKRDRREKAEAGKEEAERRKAEEERLRLEGPKAEEGKERKGGRLLGAAVQKTAEEKREEEARGMTPEMRMRMERERRARAAEARLG